MTKRDATAERIATIRKYIATASSVRARVVMVQVEDLEWLLRELEESRKALADVSKILSHDVVPV